MLGLPQQVGGAHFAVDGLVGDYQGLGRTGEQVDADAAEQLPLGFRDKGIAGADQHVDALDALSTDRHGADRLDAAEAIDDVGAGEMLGGDDGGRRLALIGRRTGDDALDPGHLGGDDRHVGGGEQRIFAARHIAADRVDRDVLVAEHDARQRLDLDVAHRRLLVLGEIAHLGLGEFDVVEVALCELRQAALDLSIGEAEILAVPGIELDGKLADRGVAALLDVGQDGLDRGANLRIVFRAQLGRTAALEIFCHRPLQKFYLIACGLIGEPAPPGRCNGGAVKKNS